MTRKTRQSFIDILAVLATITSTAVAGALALTGHPEGLGLMLMLAPFILFVIRPAA